MAAPTPLATAGVYIVAVADGDMWLEGPFASDIALRRRGEALQAASREMRWQSASLPAGFQLEVRQP